MSLIINASLEGVDESKFGTFDPLTLTYQIKVEARNSKVDPFQISCMRLRKVFKNWEAIVSCCFNEISDSVANVRRDNFLKIGEMYIEIRDKLRGDDDMTDEQIDLLQLDMDAYCELHSEMFGVGTEQNYTHLWESGDIRFHLRRLGNIHIFLITILLLLNEYEC